MTKRAIRDAIALGATALVLVLFALYMNASWKGAVEEADRNSPRASSPVLSLEAEASYEDGKEVWVEVALSNPARAELRVLEPAWPATLDFDMNAARRKEPPAKEPPAIVLIPPGGRFRRRIDLSGAFELRPGEYVVRARYGAAGERAWRGTLVSGPVRLKVASPAGLPDVFTQMEE